MDALCCLARQEEERVGARNGPYIDGSQVAETADSFSRFRPRVRGSCLGVQEFGQQLAPLLASTSLRPPAAKKTTDVEFSQRGTRKELEIARTLAAALAKNEYDFLLGGWEHSLL